MRTISKYAVLDAYGREELRLELRSRNARERVQFLVGLKECGDLRDPVVDLALEDESRLVRQWIAKNVRLSETNVAKFRTDSDDFLKACLWEGPTFGGLRPARNVEMFQAASHLERLAMMRYRLVDETLIEKVFDSSDSLFGVTDQERYELIRVILTNSAALGNSPWLDFLHGDGASPERVAHFARIWHLAAHWPQNVDVASLVYQYFPADNSTKERAYRTTKEPSLRRAILMNETPEFDERGYGLSPGFDKSGDALLKPATLLELGSADEDADCRSIAERRIAAIEATRLKQPLPARPPYRSILWRVFLGAILFALAFASLSTAMNPYETILLAVVILFAVACRQFVAMLILYHEGQRLDRSKFEFKVMLSLKDPDYSRAGLEYIVAEQSRELKKRDQILSAELVVLWALYLLCCFKIIMALIG